MKQYSGMEIAIIGMSGRFPGANNINSFWKNIKCGIESVSVFTDEELLNEGEDQSIINNPSYVKSNSILENKEYFDASFFNYRPDEAKLMDPQMRIFHECVWEALEDAGCNLNDNMHKIGVFAGCSTNVNWVVYSELENKKGLVDKFTASQLNNARFLATKISHSLNLKGPSIMFDTACSTSLVSIQQACKSLLLAECSIALAGGVSIKNESKKGYLYTEGMVHSQDGHCRAFDAEASGFIGGEGAGVVVLKTLKNALKDGDNIWAIIKGSGINNDGNDKVGYAAPSIDGQTEAIMMAQKWAKIEPESIGYIEAHGTATEMGDPIEVEALNRAFGKSAEKYCALGSVKTNIGHLDAAAGVTGFIKTVLALKNRQIPPSLHFKIPNPKINFTDTPFYVNTELKEWKNDKYPLRAGVSSFGIGGTNAHIILEEAPELLPSSESRDFQLILLSAKTQSALERNVINLKKYLNYNINVKIADIAYTLQLGRTSHAYRKAIVCRGHNDAVESLGAINFKKKIAPLKETSNQKVVFMFPGQGAQYVNMCKDLYKKELTFKNEVDRCFDIVKRISQKDLKSVLFPENMLTTENEINKTEYTQPLLFIIEYALANYLKHWGVKPDLMIGHSFGEYVAACISGVFSLEDALYLIIRRSELMQSVANGKMLGISISEDKLQNLLSKHREISYATANSSELSVVSGSDEAIEKFQEVIEKEGYLSKIVPNSYGYHSYLMDEILVQFEKEVSQVKINKPNIPFISNLTGKQVTGAEIQDPGYWVKHLRHTVRFSDGITTIMKDDNVIFLEVGPGVELGVFVRSNKLRKKGHKVVNLVKHQITAEDDLQHFLQGLGMLWVNGLEINWDLFYANESRRKVSLPTYSFEKKSYITNVDSFKLIENKIPGESVKVESYLYNSSWQRSISPNDALELIENKYNFLIFSDREGFSNQIINKLTPYDQKVIEVRQGESFKKIDSDVFELNFTEPDDYIELWNDLEKSGIQIHNIIYCAALTKQLGKIKYDDLEDNLGDYLSLSYIAKSLATLKKTDELKLVVLNNYLAYVTEGDKINAAKATIHGPSRIIPLELPFVKCKVIDIPYPFQDDKELNNYLPAIINEVFYEFDSPFVAYRFKERWVQSYNTLTENQKTKSNINIVKNGTYIITGGFGGMGFTIASDLVFQYKANVIIVHRSDFPEKKEWNKWLTEKGEEHPTSKKIQQVQKMESTGCKVYLYQVDVSDEEQVQGFLLNIKDNLPKINGLIWAAGQLDDAGIIQNRKKEDLTKNLASKVHGLLLFEKYLNLGKLDFVSLFSSMGNVFYQTKFGAVGYYAANIFLEYYAYYARERLGNHIFTINWCDWFDIGLTHKYFALNQDSDDSSSINNKIGRGIYPSEGAKIFQECLRNKLPVYNIYDGDIYKDLKAASEEYKKFKTTLSVLDDSQPNISENINNLEEKLMGIFSLFFGKDDIEPDDSFFELGGDSLKGMILLGRINQEIGIKLSIGDLYKFPTIISLSQELLKHKSNIKTENIPRTLIKESYVLSSAQKRMYFLQMYDKESIVYNATIIFESKGQLDKEKLEKAFIKLIRRHECFRTSFIFEEEIPKQKISDEFSFEVEYYTSDEAGVDTVINSFVRPFNLSEAPLLRVGIIEKGTNEYLLMIDMHHIITDGTSQRILINDFMALYKNEELPELELQYKDYAEWQQLEEQQQKIVEQREFWENEFTDEPTALQLPYDFTRPSIISYEGNTLDFEISIEETSKLKSLADSEGATMFMVILSIYNILLSKLSSQEDIVIGTPIAGRQHADLENILGVFVNTLPIRNFPKRDLSFKKFLELLKQKTIACFNNQAYPYEELINDLNIERDTSHNPLFDVMFVFQNYETSELEIPGLTLKKHNRYDISKFDITLIASENEGQLFFNFEYSNKLFRKETIERFIDYFRKIVSTILNDKNKKISDIELISEKERHQLLYDFNNTRVDYPKDKTIIDLFEEQVKLTPNSIAVICKDSKITYEELDSKSNQLGHLLREKGVVRDGLVAIMAERSIEMIIGIYGIIKAGGAYLPIDPNYPLERKKYIIDNSKASLLLVQEKFIGTISGKIEEINIEDEKIFKGNSLKLSKINSPSDLLYTIYTSGSTGDPKGVMIEQHSVINGIKWVQKQYPISEGDVILQKTPIVFDVSVWELFWWSMQGASLYMLEPGGEKDPRIICKAIKDNAITIMNFVPPMLQSFLEYLENNTEALEDVSSLNYVFASGEALLPIQANTFHRLLSKNNKAKLVNLYGPTEATVDVSYFNCFEKAEYTTIPIGKPIDNTSLYILNKNKGIQPIGVVGELYIGGICLARGYINNKALTEEKFINSPINEGERIYKTGDLARWLPDGNVEFFGRIDNQVKIRGFRIELGEIENILLENEEVIEAVVIVSGTKQNEKRLIAYVVLTDKSFGTLKLKKYLRNRLPGYMVPSNIEILDEIPLTRNGKINKKALPDPEIRVVEEFAKPKNKIQKELVKIWADILHIEEEKIGVNTNFFEIGGNSLKLIKVVDQINQHFNSEITVAKLFQFPVISLLADYLNNENQAGSGGTEQSIKDDLEQMNSVLELVGLNKK